MQDILAIIASLAISAVAAAVAYWAGPWRRVVGGILVLLGFILLLPLTMVDFNSRNVSVIVVAAAALAGVIFALTGAYTLLATGRDRDAE